MKRTILIWGIILAVMLTACSNGNLPEAPEIRVPTVELPEVDLPDIVVPTLEVPDIQVPTLEVPDINVPVSTPGETVTLDIAEQEPVSDGAARVEISMAGGTLNLSGGGTGLVNGTIEYNFPEWEPVITREESTVRIAQNIKGIPIPQTGSDLVNRWNLQLGDTPMALNVTAGAAEGTLNLSGVPLMELEIQGGANDTNVRFDTPNPQKMSRFTYRSGASSAELTGLSNANFAEMSFTGAAGSYTLDFSGQSEQDATVNINGTVGGLTLRIPAGRAARVNVNGALSDIDTTGGWQTGENTYTLSGSGPALTINIAVAIGDLNLISE